MRVKIFLNQLLYFQFVYNIFKKLFEILLSKIRIFKLFRKYFEDRISVDESLENKIINIKPDLIILPTKASDTYYFDLKKYQISIKLIFYIS